MIINKIRNIIKKQIKYFFHFLTSAELRMDLDDFLCGSANGFWSVEDDEAITESSVATGATGAEGRTIFAGSEDISSWKIAKFWKMMYLR